MNAQQRSNHGGETSFSPACRSSWRVAPPPNRRSEAMETHSVLTRRGIWRNRLVKMGRFNQQELASVHVLPLSQAKRQAPRYIVQARAKDQRCTAEAQRRLFSIAVVDATNGPRSRSASEVASHSRLRRSPLSLPAAAEWAQRGDSAHRFSGRAGKSSAAPCWIRRYQVRSLSQTP